MTKKTAIKALHTSTLFGVYSRRDEVVEARGHNFTTCTEWLDAHFGKNNVYPIQMQMGFTGKSTWNWKEV